MCKVLTFSDIRAKNEDNRTADDVHLHVRMDGNDSRKADNRNSEVTYVGLWCELFLYIASKPQQNTVCSVSVTLKVDTHMYDCFCWCHRSRGWTLS